MKCLVKLQISIHPNMDELLLISVLCILFCFIISYKPLEAANKISNFGSQAGWSVTSA
jgi:hypothetical protein